ncbi:ABC1 kinase family protein [Aquihabitans daechungensis]|uniref:ABC1 kinase family protein n=1 Tax=Aquihabitans daechungensis TaxID=1052257 RepID=UPI003BA27F47
MSTPRTRALLAFGAAAAAGGVVWYRQRSQAQPASVGPIGATGRLQRSALIASTATKLGGGWAVDQARGVFADAARREELDLARQLKSAEAVAEALGNMKGAMMKLGQMASYLDQGMPETVREALAELQQDAPPMAPELAAQVVTQELGAGPDVLFAEWDPVPIAAASIGQVHRAMTHDGRAVAVKVQYPGVDAAIKGDLDNAGMLFTAMTFLFPGLDPEPLVEELRDRIIEELDYRLEADNQRLFAEAYAGHPYIHVPAVVDELSALRVITTELAPGVRFAEMLTWSQEERNLAAETIYRFVFGSLYRLAAFNGDPHPGNYLFEPGGKVTFLDYGLVKRFTPEELQPFEDMIKAMVLDHDIAEFRRIVEDVGLLAPNPDFTDEAIGDYFGHFYEFVQNDEELTVTEEFASETVRRFFDTSGVHGDIMRAANVPKSMVIIQRINLGLYAILGQLEATANWRRLAEEIWPWTGGPPATPMGVAEAAWRERRSAAVASSTD